MREKSCSSKLAICLVCETALKNFLQSHLSIHFRSPTCMTISSSPVMDELQANLEEKNLEATLRSTPKVLRPCTTVTAFFLPRGAIDSTIFFSASVSFFLGLIWPLPPRFCRFFSSPSAASPPAAAVESRSNWSGRFWFEKAFEMVFHS